MYKIYYLTSILDCYQPRYVGYTTNIEKRLKEHILSAKYKKSKSYKNNWIMGLLKKGINPEIVLLDKTKSVAEVLDFERIYIESFREWFKLTNSTNGGETSKTFIESVKQKISNSLKEYYKENDTWNKGLKYKFSEERNRKRRLKIGDKISGENNHFWGKTHTLETRKKLSKIHRKYDYNYEIIFNMYIKQNLMGSEISKKLQIPYIVIRKAIKKYNLKEIKVKIYGKIKGKKEKIADDFDFDQYYEPDKYF